jgi:hypothetical protein
MELTEGPHKTKFVGQPGMVWWLSIGLQVKTSKPTIHAIIKSQKKTLKNPPIVCMHQRLPIHSIKT